MSVQNMSLYCKSDGSDKVRDWIKGRDDDEQVADEDGGLALVIVGEDAYLEVGGVPDEGEDEGEDL